MDELAVRREVWVAFEYSYLHEDWVTPLGEALDGVTVERALWKPNPEVKSIWQIVLHLAAWHENIVERIRTGEATHPSEGAWPPLPPITDEGAWEASKRRLWDSLESVMELLRSTPLDKIQASPYGLADLLCRMTHNGYHIGQITKLREWAESVSG